MHDELTFNKYYFQDDYAVDKAIMSINTNSDKNSHVLQFHPHKLEYTIVYKLAYKNKRK